MLFRSVAALAMGAALLVLSTGCGGDKPTEVTGKVTLDDVDLAEGDIIFEAADGKGTPSAGKIVGGKYSVSVQPGFKKVRISASKATGKVDPVMGTAPVESIIPKQYNTETKLSADIKPGAQEVDFKLKSKP